MNIIFVRTRQKYDSYQDFWKLVELSGFDTCFVDEVRYDRAVLYILPTVNAEVEPHLRKDLERIESERLVLQAIVVWWSLERPDSSTERLSEIGKGVYTGLEDALPLFDLVWSSDRWWVHEQRASRRIVFVPMGSHPDLAIGGRWRFDQKMDNHYCHFSYVAGRRGPVHEKLSHLRAGPNGWGEERGRIMRSSQTLVNIHQTQVPMGEPLRFAVAAAYGIPMVSENCNDPWPLDPGTDFVSCKLDVLPMIVAGVVNTPPKDMEKYADALHWRLCVEHPFKTEVLLGVKLTKDVLFHGGAHV